MEHSKSGLYIVAIVGIIAVVAIVLIVIAGNKDKTVISSGTSTAKDAAGRSYDLGYCHYEDGSSTGCPCVNPSDGVISIGAKLISNNC
jgi:hypothetical protein